MSQRVLLVDAHPAIAEGIESCFRDYPAISVAATAMSGIEGLERLRQIAVDVVVAEMTLPDMDGAEAIALYREEFPEVEILVYSGRDDESSVFRALKAGARGYVLKSRPLEELALAIQQIDLNEYYLSPDLNPAIIHFYLENRDKCDDRLAEYQSLTKRERQVFRFLANGRQTSEIAGILCISPKTVAKHRAAIKKKLSLKNPAEMAQYAIQSGLIPVHPPEADNENNSAAETSTSLPEQNTDKIHVVK